MVREGKAEVVAAERVAAPSAAAKLLVAICALLLAAATATFAPQAAYAEESSGEIICSGLTSGGSYSLAVGTNVSYGVSFGPHFNSMEDHDAYEGISPEVKNAQECWAVKSSDPSVLEVKMTGSAAENWALELTPRAAGSATVSVSYSYQGWSAQSNYSISVLAEENVATALTLDATSVMGYCIAKCPKCGEFHGDNSEPVGYTLTAKDPSKPLSPYRLEVADSDFDFANVSILSEDDPNKFSVYMKQPGERQITVCVVSGTTGDVWAKAKLTVKPTNQAPSIACSTDKIAMCVGGFSYVDWLIEPNETARLCLGYHDEGSSHGFIDSVTSSNPGVVEVEGQTVDGAPTGYKLVAVAPGTANVTIRDAFGVDHVIAVTVTSAADADLTGIGFRQDNITLKLGELSPSTFDLVTEKAYDALSSGPFWVLGCNGNTVVNSINKDNELYYKAVGAGVATVEMQISNPDDPRHPIIADTMTITVVGEQVAASSADSIVSASVEANNTATLDAVKAAAEAAGDDLVLSVQDVTDLTEAARASIVGLASDGKSIAGQFDIHFATATGGKEVVVNKDANGNLAMTVRIALTDAMKALDPNSLKVWYVADDGKTEEKTTWVEGGNLCFVTEHFSNYVVTGEPPVGAAAAGDANGAASESVGATKPKAAVLAQTGDALPPIACAVCAGLFGAVAALALARRKLA